MRCIIIGLLLLGLVGCTSTQQFTRNYIPIESCEGIKVWCCCSVDNGKGTCCNWADRCLGGYVPNCVCD